MKLSSKCVSEVKELRKNPSHILPIYPTSSFTFDSLEDSIDIFKGTKDGYVYSRYGNPTMETVAYKLALLEGHGSDSSPYCYLTSSGMSAIFSTLSTLLEPGDKILTQGNLYGGSTELILKRFQGRGMEVILCDLTNSSAVEDAINKNENIRVIYMESPANPTLACIDVQSITELAKSHNILTVIDNTFATPLLQRPLLLGADFVVHSTTKYLNGHGNAIGGAIISNREDYKLKIWELIKLAGTNWNPFDAWLTYNGLKTLALRMDRHCDNALALAKFLENHPKIVKVNYPGLLSHPNHELAKRQMAKFGGMLSFEISGGFTEGVEFVKNLTMCTLAPTLGDVDTLLLHPASSSHLKVDKEIRERNGITDGLIRVSVGIEDIEDIISDFENSLATIKS